MCFYRYLLSFLRLINESKQNIDNLSGEDRTRLLSESSYKRINTVVDHDICNGLDSIDMFCHDFSAGKL